MKVKQLLFFLIYPLSLCAQGIDWGTPQTVSGGPGLLNSLRPDIAASDSGTAIAAWEDTINGVGGRIRTSVYDPNTQTWEAFVDVGDGSFPQIAMDANGNAFLIIRDIDIRVSRYDSSTETWSAFTVLGGGFPFNPNVAMTPSGDALAVWANTSPTGLITASYSIATDTWTPRGAVPNGGGPTSTLPPIVSVDDAGNGVAIWRDISNNQVKVSHYNALTGTWDNATVVSNGTDNNTSGWVDADPSGNATAVWTTTAGIVQASTYDSLLGTWSTPEDISPAGETSSTTQVSMDGSGNAFAVWNNTTVGRIQVSFYDAITGTWGTPENISPGSATNPKIDMDLQGNAVVVWLTGGVIQSVLYSVSEGMWQTTPDNVSGSGASEPFLAIDNNGNAYADWRIGTPAIQANAGILQIPPEPPQNATGISQTVRFPFQSERTIILSWEASPSSNIVSYRIYRDGVLIGEVSAGGPLTFSDYCTPFNTQITYEITAVNNLGLESEVATVVV